MNITKFVLGVLFLSGNIFYTEAQEEIQVSQYPGYRLIWEENFSASGLPDSTYWGYESGYMRNNELQAYDSLVFYSRTYSCGRVSEKGGRMGEGGRRGGTAAF